jgi:hypothetical protein
VRFVTRPLPAVWPTGQRTPASERQWSRFKAPWSNTMELLERELRYLDAAEPVVIEAGYEPRHIRLDGQPYANARPNDPAVVVSFGSRLGPLRYSCDAYHEHAANLRAIALTLEALRAVDRYGATKRAEQYRGFEALPPAAEPGMSREEAEAFIRHAGAAELEDWDYGRRDPSLRDVYRRAAKRLHPDVGGDPEQWARLDRARQVVGL